MNLKAYHRTLITDKDKNNIYTIAKLYQEWKKNQLFFD